MLVLPASTRPPARAPVRVEKAVQFRLTRSARGGIVVVSRHGERTLRLDSKNWSRPMMTMALADRPFLGSVRTALTDRIRFCSRCGITCEERELGAKPAGLERVCSRCGMGVMLSCSRDALPTDGMSFLIVTEDLRVSAVSEAAERIFGQETELLGTMLFTTMACPLGLEELALRIASA